MEWWLFLIVIVGIFLFMLAAGLPVFLAFTVVDVLGRSGIENNASGR